MNRMLGLALIVVGLILAYYGFQEGASPVGEAVEALTGSPPDRSVGKMIFGLLIAAIGGGLFFYRAK